MIELLVTFSLVYTCIQSLFFLNCLNSRRREQKRLERKFRSSLRHRETGSNSLISTNKSRKFKTKDNQSNVKYKLDEITEVEDDKEIDTSSGIFDSDEQLLQEEKINSQKIYKTDLEISAVIKKIPNECTTEQKHLHDDNNQLVSNIAQQESDLENIAATGVKSNSPLNHITTNNSNIAAFIHTTSIDRSRCSTPHVIATASESSIESISSIDSKEIKKKQNKSKRNNDFENGSKDKNRLIRCDITVNSNAIPETEVHQYKSYCDYDLVNKLKMFNKKDKLERDDSSISEDEGLGCMQRLRSRISKRDRNLVATISQILRHPSELKKSDQEYMIKATSNLSNLKQRRSSKSNPDFDKLFQGELFKSIPNLQSIEEPKILTETEDIKSEKEKNSDCHAIEEKIIQEKTELKCDKEINLTESEQSLPFNKRSHYKSPKTVPRRKLYNKDNEDVITDLILFSKLHTFSDVNELEGDNTPALNKSKHRNKTKQKFGHTLPRSFSELEKRDSFKKYCVTDGQSPATPPSLTFLNMNSDVSVIKCHLKETIPNSEDNNKSVSSLTNDVKEKNNDEQSSFGNTIDNKAEQELSDTNSNDGSSKASSDVLSTFESSMEVDSLDQLDDSYDEKSDGDSPLTENHLGNLVHSNEVKTTSDINYTDNHKTVEKTVDSVINVPCINITPESTVYEDIMETLTSSSSTSASPCLDKKQPLLPKLRPSSVISRSSSDASSSSSPGMTTPLSASSLYPETTSYGSPRSRSTVFYCSSPSGDLSPGLISSESPEPSHYSPDFSIPEESSDSECDDSSLETKPVNENLHKNKTKESDLLINNVINEHETINNNDNENDNNNNNHEEVTEHHGNGNHTDDLAFNESHQENHYEAIKPSRSHDQSMTRITSQSTNGHPATHAASSPPRKTSSNSNRASLRQRQQIQGLDELIADDDGDEDYYSKKGLHSTLSVPLVPSNMTKRNLSRTTSEPPNPPPPPPPLPLRSIENFTNDSFRQDGEDTGIRPSDFVRRKSSQNNNNDIKNDIPVYLTNEGLESARLTQNTTNETIEDDNSSPKQSSPSSSRGNVAFIPPNFPSQPLEGGLIKPSEYLRSLNGSSRNGGQLNFDHIGLPPGASGLPVIPEGGEESKTIPQPPPAPPLPPPIPASNGSSEQTSTMTSTTVNRNGNQMPAISVTDLQSVQLKKTDKISKTTSVPLKFGSDPNLQSQKNNVIAELKMGVDIDGIKKLKNEQLKDETLSADEERKFTSKEFFEQVPAVDNAGNPIPEWKRQMLARKAAEKAKKEAEEDKRKEAEQRRLAAIPKWKRELLARKDEETKRSPQSNNFATKIEETKKVKVVNIQEDSSSPTSTISSREGGQNGYMEDNVSSTYAKVSPKKNKEDRSDSVLTMNKNVTLVTKNSTNSTNVVFNSNTAARSSFLHSPTVNKAISNSNNNNNNANANTNSINNDFNNNDDEIVPIVPWRAQLRKTNSKLSLLE